MASFGNRNEEDMVNGILVGVLSIMIKKRSGFLIR